jgi:F-type H+-transporting ATPase subunit b
MHSRRPEAHSGRHRLAEDNRPVNDVKADVQSIAQSRGKSMAKTLRDFSAAATQAIAAGTSHFRSNPEIGESPLLNFAPMLLIAATLAGAAAALVIVLGFAFLDSPRSAILPLEARLTELARRVQPLESARTALTNRVAAAEAAIAKSASLGNSTFTATQQIEKTLALLPGRNIFSPEKRATELSEFERLENRVLALENKLGLPARREVEMQPAPRAAETSRGETNFPPFDPVNFTPMLVWLAVSFGGLYLLMAKIALPRVETILQSRTHKIRADIADANKLRAQSEEASTALEKLIADAKSKALTLAQETRAKLLAETESQRVALESELNARLAGSEAQIVEMKARAMSHVETIANEAAAAIVQRITGKPADPSAIANAIVALKA